MQGVVKVYDPATGAGVVVLDADRREVYLREGSLDGSVFRLLRQGQRVVVTTTTEGDQDFVTHVGLGTEGAV
jgi:CspA family cold shock protein